MKRVGVINAAGIFDAVKSIFGNITIGDQVPNYPIKSRNTEAALRAEVNQNIPYPTSVADAQALIQKAEQLKEQNLKRDNSQRVIDTIRMMYDEAIQFLRQYISQNQGNVPQSGSGGNLPATGTDTQKKPFPWLPVLGGAAVLYLLTKKKR